MEAFYALPEDEQELWISRHERERDRCSKCNGDRHVCSRPEQAWYPQRTVCFADMEAQAANAAYDRLHKDLPYHDGTFTSWAKEPVDENGALTHPYHYRDGVTVWVSPLNLTPTDRFLTNRSAPAQAPEPARGGEHGDKA